MIALTLDEIKGVSAGVSFFYPTLLLGQILVSSASAYATMIKIKTNFLTYSGSQTIVNVITFPIFGMPIGAIAMTGAGAMAGYYAYHIIEAI